MASKPNNAEQQGSALRYSCLAQPPARARFINLEDYAQKPRYLKTAKNFEREKSELGFQGFFMIREC